MNYNDFLKSNEWKDTKDFFKNVSNRECYICAYKESLNVHHLSYSSFRYEDKNDLIYLCLHHHYLFHFPKGKNCEKRDMDTREGLLKSLLWLDSKMRSFRMKNNIKVIEYKNNSPLLLYNRLTKKVIREIPSWVLKRKERIKNRKEKSIKTKRSKGIETARQNYLNYMKIEECRNKEYLPYS
jgi:hypothetical protein